MDHMAFSQLIHIDLDCLRNTLKHLRAITGNCPHNSLILFNHCCACLMIGKPAHTCRTDKKTDECEKRNADRQWTEKGKQAAHWQLL
ncbi:MAG: hypothetical protein ACRCWO_10795 [Bosea sp. (in: a-proteobacteria)]